MNTSETKMDAGSQLSIDLSAAVAVSRPLLASGLIVFADMLGITVAAACAIALRLVTGGTFRIDQLLAWWPLPILVVLFIAQARGYARTPPHPAEELRRLSTATTLAFAMLVTATFFLRSFETYSRVAVLVALAFSWITVPLARAVMRGWCTRYTWWGVPVVVVGAGITAAGVIQSLQRWPSRGLRPIIALDDNPAKHGSLISGIPVVGPLEPAALAAAQAGITTLLVAMPGAPPERVRMLWRRLGPHFPSVLVVPGLGEFASLWVEAKDIGGQVALELRQSLLRPSRRFMKRTIDLLLVGLLLVVSSPLLLALMTVVYVSSPGPIFYGQLRLGRNAMPFKAWKFRTMRRDADVVLTRLLASDPLLQAEWDRDHKLRVDPRVTMIGRFLRKTSLDELPQLWNVMSGDMSLVGPRPVTQAEVGKYGEQWELYKRVRPGITGQWQVSGRNHTTYEERVAWDAFYVHNWSPWLDFVILARTVQTVVRGEGAY